MVPNQQPEFLNQRYELLDVLGAGGMGVVYRARDRLTGRIVALKRVTTPPHQLNFASRADDQSPSSIRLALAQEFQTLASLRHPKIIDVLDYGFDAAHQPYFTMELLDDAVTIIEAGRGQPLEIQVALLLQALQALAYLHRRGVIHRDLKPENVLVAGGQVRVLDFGLSIISAQTTDRVADTVVGTLQYMAPELFQSKQGGRGADLYALGVMAYEMIAGHPLFRTDNILMLINDIANTPPDLDALGVDDNLSAVIGCLLEKRRVNRYHDVDETIRAVCAAVGCALPPETVEIRESFLQAASFVGRDKELVHLTVLLDEALDGHGSAWLIGGESGVGKSRLVEELRIRALVAGAQVLRGQAISEGGGPYHLWRDVLRSLALQITLSDEEASVLKPLVTDIADLLGRDIPDIPPMDPQAMQFWLFKTVATLLGRLAQPTLIILEDLQWVGSESIAMLERLVPVTSTVPLLILGNYRNDERPDLPEWLPGMAVYTLDRLDEPAIADLSMSMLGEAGRDPQVVSLLQRESEGNAFFLIEVVRALAEEAGTLDRIALITLPARVFAGGIRDVVQRRLRRVPTWARPLLNLAAMAGREIDVALMVALNGRSIASWLTTCASAAVLEQPEDRWRFTHDKLREGVLEELSDDERPALHRQVAEALENVYDEDPHQIPALAYHYQHAQIRDKAIHYLTQAGHNARTSYANEEALTFYKHAVDQVTPLLEEKTEPEKWSGVMGELEESLGAVLLLMARRADAQSAFQRALAQVPENDRIWQSRLYRKMAKILEEQRYLEDALQIYNIALAKLGDEQCEPVSIWWQEWIENQVEHMRMYYWLGKLHEAEELAEQMKPVVEQQGTPEQRGKFFNSLALTGIRRERYVPSDLTVSYARSAVVAIQESDNLVETVWIQFIFGFVLLWYGALDEAEEELRKAQALTERVGDVTTLSRCLAYLTVLYRKQGRVDKVREYSARSMAVAVEGDMTEYIATAKANQAWLHLREGNIADAQVSIQEAHTLFQQTVQANLFNWLFLWPLIGILLVQGNLPEAIPHVRALFSPTTQPMPETIARHLEVALQAWDGDDLEKTRAHLDQASVIAREIGYL